MTTGDHTVTASFDLILVVDWSASSRPTRGSDSIWIAGRSPVGAGTEILEPFNPSTRAAAVEWIADLVTDHETASILIGIDASLGAPAGVAAAVGGRPGWESWWDTLAELVDDRPDNDNNRWQVAAELNRRIARHTDPGASITATHPGTAAETVDGSRPLAGPFWGGPAAAEVAGLGRRRPERFAVPEYRLCETELRRSGRRPFPLWQLAYAGSVGSQALLAVAALVGLRRRIGDRMRIWPFEAGSVGDAGSGHGTGRVGQVVVAEVWPSMWPLELGSHPIRDAAQVVETAALVAEAPLADWLDTADLPEIARAEEGWILGLPPPGSTAGSAPVAAG